MNHMDCAIVIPSWDKSQLLWEPVLDSLNRFWKDCPLEVFIITNSIKKDDLGATFILTGDEVSWCRNFEKGLDQIDKDYILVILDDYLISRPVDSRITEYFDLIHKNDINCISFCHKQSGKKAGHSNLIEYVGPGMPYRVNLQIGLWKKKELVRLLQQSRTPWEFEKDGSRYSRNVMGQFACVNRNVDLPIMKINCLVKGKITRSGKGVLEEGRFDEALMQYRQLKWFESDIFFSSKRIVREHIEFMKYIINIR
jgi:hypothetical protein